jgi:hypothetical protein
MRVAHGDDQARVIRTVDEQPADHRHHGRERVPGAVLAERVVVDVHRRQRPIGVDGAADGALPRLPDDRAEAERHDAGRDRILLGAQQPVAQVASVAPPRVVGRHAHAASDRRRIRMATA